MNDNLKALLALDRLGLAKFLDHRRLVTAPVFEELVTELIHDFKQHGDTTILRRLIKLFEDTPFKDALTESLCTAAGLKSYVKDGEVQLAKSGNTSPRDFDMKGSLAARPAYADEKKPKKFRKSPQSAKGPKYPKQSGKRYDPYAPRGKNAVRPDAPEQEGRQQSGRPAGKFGANNRPGKPAGDRPGKPAGRRFYDPKAPRGGAGGNKFGKPKFAGRKKH